MLYRSVGGLFVMLLAGGLLFADETRGFITKIEDGTVTVRSGGGFGNQKQEATEKTFKIGKDVKVVRSGGKEKPDVTLTYDELKTAVKVTNVFATVTHEGENASEIKVGGFGGQRRKKDDK